MGKYIKFRSEVKPLTFNNQYEAFKRYLLVLSISIILLIDTITMNLVAYLILYQSFNAQNNVYGRWFTITTFLSLGLLILALFFYLLPSIPRSKETSDELIRGRDFIKIVRELFMPTERKYWIIGLVKSISRIIGIAAFLANLVLIFVGLFIYYIPR